MLSTCQHMLQNISLQLEYYLCPNAHIEYNNRLEPSAPSCMMLFLSINNNDFNEFDNFDHDCPPGLYSCCSATVPVTASSYNFFSHHHRCTIRKLLPMLFHRSLGLRVPGQGENPPNLASNAANVHVSSRMRPECQMLPPLGTITI